MRSKQQDMKLAAEEGQILVMSFDTTNAGLTQTLSGEIIMRYRV